MIDLDQRAAEAGLTPRTMRFAGRDWPLPATLPMDALTPLAQLIGQPLEDLTNDELGAFVASCRALLGAHADEILALGFGLQHFAWLLESYGMTLGEAPASSQP